MSAHVLFNLLNEFEESDKMRGERFISFSQRINKFNTIYKSKMSHSIYHNYSAVKTL